MRTDWYPSLKRKRGLFFAYASGSDTDLSSSLMRLAPLSTMRMGRPMGVLFCFFQSMPSNWQIVANVTHREILRRGHAYVGVSAQKVGIEGGRGEATRPGLAPLKKADSKRYGRLSHPGDAYAYDIFSQAGRL